MTGLGSSRKQWFSHIAGADDWLKQIQKEFSIHRQYAHFWQRLYSEQLETPQDASIERLWSLLAGDQTPS